MSHAHHASTQHTPMHVPAHHEQPHDGHAAASQPPPPASAPVHMVAQGESVRAIIHQHGISRADFLAVNPQIRDIHQPLQNGETVNLPRVADVHAAQPSRTALPYTDTVTAARGSGRIEGTYAKAIARHNTRTSNPAPKNGNRIVHLQGPDKYQPVHFAVKADTPMLDGLSGRVRGHIAGDRITLNYGQHKTIDGQDCVYAFSARTRDGQTRSGWIPTRQLVHDASYRAYEKELKAVDTTHAEQGPAPESFTVKGARRDLYGQLKVKPNVAREDNVAAKDYLLSKTGTVNLLSALPGHGGVANDTFAPSASVRFIPDAGMPHVRIPLYLPKDATTAERHDWVAHPEQHYMEFVYGSIDGRDGWIAADNLEPFSPLSMPSMRTPLL